MAQEPLHIATGKYDWLSAVHETSSEGDVENRALIIMIHGFPGSHKDAHNNVFQDIEYRQLKNGYDTLRFDFRGCGDSDGRSWDFTFQTARQDIKAVYEWAKKQGYKNFHIVAEGLGACFALMEQSEEIKSFVFLWPLLFPSESYLKEYIEKGKAAPKEAPFIDVEGQRVGKVMLKQLEECEISTYIQSTALPILILHGQKDEKIPFSQISHIRENATTSLRIDITRFEDGEHGLLKPNERASMQQHISQFLQKYT
jgi:pimeloyl-ACP methyl ester carboxylesterase